MDEKIEKLQAKNTRCEQQLWEQMKKVLESLTKEHSKLLNNRTIKYQKLFSKQEKIQSEIEKIEKQKCHLGEVIQRADRDFRKQTIMTFRTAWTENALKEFVDLLTQSMDEPVDIEIILNLFFNRRGLVLESDTEVCYWVDGNNLSPRYQQILGEIIRGFNSISLAYKGKNIFVKLVDFS